MLIVQGVLPLGGVK